MLLLIFLYVRFFLVFGREYFYFSLCYLNYIFWNRFIFGYDVLRGDMFKLLSRLKGIVRMVKSLEINVYFI